MSESEEGAHCPIWSSEANYRFLSWPWSCEHSSASQWVPNAVFWNLIPPPRFFDLIDYVVFCGTLDTEHVLLKKKYLQESSERKRLYNEVIELKGNIRVFCRCRPLNQNEITSGSTSIVDFDSSQDNELQVICSDSSKKQFKFDHVFRPEDNQGTL